MWVFDSHPSYKLLIFTLCRADIDCSLSARWRGTASVPYLEEAVPGSCAARHAVWIHANAAHSVVVTSQHAWTTANMNKHDVSWAKCHWKMTAFDNWFSFNSLWFLLALTHSLRFKWVPDVDVEVIVASQYQSSRNRGGQGGHPTHDAGVLVGDEVLVGSQVMQLTGGVIGSGYHCIAVGEKLKERRVGKNQALWKRMRHSSA